MVIYANGKEVNVSSVVSTTINCNGKSYPALKFIMEGEASADDILNLASGDILIDEFTHEGYTTLGEVSVVVGKVTTAEQERDALANELNTAQAEHMEYKEQVGVILPKLDDATALSVKGLFPTWDDCVKLGYVESEIGFRFTYNGDLYKCKNENPTFQSDWIPGNGTESLYVKIDETHEGSIEDPIPYDGNMVLFDGVYYEQDGVIYLCNRDTGNAVYNPLSELVGLYVETV